jgi:hypothetical protein
VIDLFAVGLCAVSPILFGLLCASAAYRILNILEMIEP